MEGVQDACTKHGFLHYLDLMGEFFDTKMSEGASIHRAFVGSAR